MKAKGKGYSAIHNYTAAVLAFYKINDIVLNVTKINKFIPAQKKVKKDRAYTHEEISKLLEIADERMSVIILLMASSGIRVGALSLLRLRNLDNQNSKLTVYENDREEYFAFITPECKKAIDSYLDFRSRYGEKVDKSSFLLREQFDIKDPFQVRKPRPLTVTMVKCKLIDLQQRIGIRSKEVATNNGFRKFFTTPLINSKVNPEIREMLLGHKIGLASCYYRPTEEEMLNEYMKAVNNLTINEENRLRKRVDELSEKNKDNEYIIRGKLEEKDKQIEVLAKKQEKTDLLIQSLIDSGQIKPKQEIMNS